MFVVLLEVSPDEYIPSLRDLGCESCNRGTVVIEIRGVVQILRPLLDHILYVRRERYDH